MAEAHWNGGTCYSGQQPVIWGPWGVWGQPDWGFAGMIWMQKWYINGIIILYANIFFYRLLCYISGILCILFFTGFYVGSLNKSSEIPGIVICVCVFGLCLQTCFLNRWWTYIIQKFSKVIKLINPYEHLLQLQNDSYKYKYSHFIRSIEQ